MFGPKCTGFIIVMSIWGAVFLGILGGLYYNQSVGLLEDLPDEASGMEQTSWEDRVKHIKDLFNQNAYNCWVAAGVYAGLAVVFGIRAFYLCR